MFTILKICQIYCNINFMWNFKYKNNECSFQKKNKLYSILVLKGPTLYPLVESRTILVKLKRKKTSWISSEQYARDGISDVAGVWS